MLLVIEIQSKHIFFDSIVLSSHSIIYPLLSFNKLQKAKRLLEDFRAYKDNHWHKFLYIDSASAPLVLIQQVSKVI